MPAGEREALKRSITLAEKDERGESPEFSRDVKKSVYNPGGGNSGLTNRQLQRNRRILEAGTPQPVGSRERYQLEKREKVLIAACQTMMVPRKMTQLRKMKDNAMDPQFGRAANDMAKKEFSKEYLRCAHELKNIRRRLHPDDPEAGNLENIRPD